jgi:hypothetical protein
MDRSEETLAMKFSCTTLLNTVELFEHRNKDIICDTVSLHLYLSPTFYLLLLICISKIHKTKPKGSASNIKILI